jgi:hypothetical protein
MSEVVGAMAPARMNGVISINSPDVAAAEANCTDCAGPSPMRRTPRPGVCNDT